MLKLKLPTPGDRKAANKAYNADIRNWKRQHAQFETYYRAEAQGVVLPKPKALQSVYSMLLEYTLDYQKMRRKELQLDEVTLDLMALQYEHQGLKERCEEQAKQIAELTAQVHTGSVDLEAARAEIASLKEHVPITAAEESPAAELTLEPLSKVVMDWKRRALAAEAKHVEYEAALEGCKGQINEWAARAVIAESQVTALEQVAELNCTVCANTIKQLIQDVQLSRDTSVTGQIDQRATEQHISASAADAELSGKLAHTEQQLEARDEQVTKLREQLAMSEAARQTQQADLTAAKQQLEARDEQVTELREQLAMSEAARQTQQADLTAAKQQLEARDEQVTELREQLQSCHHTIDNVRAQGSSEVQLMKELGRNVVKHALSSGALSTAGPELRVLAQMFDIQPEALPTPAPPQTLLGFLGSWVSQTA